MVQPAVLKCAGPLKQLIEASDEPNFSVEIDDSRRAAFRRTSTSVKAVAERIRADRHAAASLAATGTLGFAGSIGAFSTQGPSLSAKVSASQYSLGDCFTQFLRARLPVWEIHSRASQTLIQQDTCEVWAMLYHVTVGFKGSIHLTTALCPTSNKQQHCLHWKCSLSQG